MDFKEHEMICNKCEGSGEASDGVFICDKCNGTGKVDWISNVTGVPYKYSVLDRINIRRLIQYIHNTIRHYADSGNEEEENIISNIESTLELIKQKRGICDYIINRNGKNKLDIILHPNRTVEYIKMNVKIK